MNLEPVDMQNLMQMAGFVIFEDSFGSQKQYFGLWYEGVRKEILACVLMGDSIPELFQKFLAWKRKRQ